MKTLDDENDLHFLMHEFYTRMGNDEVLAPFFADLNLESHLPRLVSFWSSLLFGTATYPGGMMDVHVRVNQQQPLTVEAFQRWLKHLQETIQEHFTGEKAEEMNQRANQIAQVMSFRLNGTLPG